MAVKRVQFQATLKFDGTVDEFQELLAGFEKMKESGLMIGTWPTPERGFGTVAIDTVPLPERPFPGIFPFVRYITLKDWLKKLEEMPRFPLIDDIYGGIRNPHLHIGDDIIIITNEIFNPIVKEVLTKITDEKLQSADYNEIAIKADILAQENIFGI